MFVLNPGRALFSPSAAADRDWGGRRQPSRRTRCRPLALERLEARCLLSYSITDLGTLPGDNFSAADGINNLGQVVGESGDHAFLYDKGTLIDLGALPGSPRSGATAINDFSQVVGWSGELYTAAHAFLYESGLMTDLGTLPGDTFSRAHGIN